MASPPDRGPWQPRYGLGRLWLPPLTLMLRQWDWVPPGTADLGTLSQPSPCSSLGFSAHQWVVGVLWVVRGPADVVG